MAPKKDPKEAAASTKKKDTPTAPATASAKKTAPPATGSKVVTKERKEKVQTKALKAKQRAVR